MAFVRESFIAAAVLVFVLLTSCEKETTTATKGVPLPAVGSRAPLFTLADVNGRK